MKKTFTIAICLVLFVSLSCTRHTPDHTTIRLKPGEFADFSDANIKPVKLVEIENPEDSYLGYIRRAQWHLGNYYLLNHAGEFYELLKYDHDGSFVKRIGGIGRGPSEYISASDFAIDQSTGNIFIINHSNKILKYSPNGDFLGEIPNEIMSPSFELVNAELFFRYHGKSEDYEHQVISVSDTQGVVKAVLHETHYASGHIDEINFFRDQAEVYFREIFDNKIYRVTGEAVEQVIEFDFGDHNFNPEFANMDILGIYEEMVLKGSFLAFIQALIVNEWVYATFSNEKVQIRYHILYNTSKREYKSFKTTEKTGLSNAHLLDEAGGIGFFATGASVEELFNDEQLKSLGFNRKDISEDSNWLLWLAM